ncbi:outer membrane protein assembly factor BamB family protein [Chitinophaga niabensis]|uniref:Outer membrane protein assembly factor BamB, contains PQQ-like beta-propeller repeat n=1 Tax=Chitinophaga niabensis TaxID=536979 RepID=A0A1N6DUQ3_9BACT|nr:PQQ-binding-like beta-propeller repeat protein [Chitinophaga niabensis]SIN74526.1 Outer membrane protein assembly factor BamB, contains PQQ-like beta-propeller repeat [Chitinophaga niabensis]
MKHFYLILLCASLGFTANAQDTSFRFALVTDTHVGTETGAEDLERTVADINQQADIAFVIFSGDVTEFGSDEELKLSKSIISKLTKPWHIIPGNHDTKWSESGCNSFRTVYGDETFSFEHKGYLFLGTNCGPNMRMGPGQVPRENIVWLDEQLKKQKNKQQPIIYVNHYPQDSGLNNWYDVLDRLRSRNVKAMLCGHGHVNKAFDFEGKPGIMCRSNLRAKAAIGGYNIISVTADSLHFNERTPGVETRKAWTHVALNGPAWMQNPPRPSYSVNTTYPSVKVKWMVQEAGDMGSAVAIADGKVIYTNTNGDIKAVNLQTGKAAWKYHTQGKIYATPLVYEKYVVVPSTDGKVYCLNIQTGKLAWQQETGKAIVSSAALSGKLAIIAGSDGHCRAWDIPTGKMQWDYDSVKGFVETKPMVYEGKVYFGSWGNKFYALDANTGQPAWTWSNGANNRMFSPAAMWPVAIDQKAYLVSPDRYMTVLNTNTGSELWRFRDTANWVREALGISVDSNRVYAKTMQGNVMAFNARSNAREIVWKSPVEMGYEICPSPINEFNGVVYVAGQSGVVHALSAKDGSLIWQHKFSNCLVNTVQPVNDKMLIASSMDGKLLCLEY